MNDHDIDHLLNRLRESGRLPAPDLRREVLSSIAQLKERPSFWGRLLPVLNWNELLLQPRLAACALALALIVGMLPGAISRVTPGRGSDVHLARGSLHLDVFDSNWNNLARGIASQATIR